MEVKAIKTRLFGPGDDLWEFLLRHLPRLAEDEIVVITSKIVALAQGRIVSLAKASDKAHWIKLESQKVIKAKWCYLTECGGDWLPNAGVDESNTGGRLILLPKDTWRVTMGLWRRLRHHYRLGRLGVIITDTRSRPLRAGTNGVALAYAGFAGLRDYRGRLDLFGRPLAVTQSNAADTLASAAVWVMGEGAEQTPLALIRRSGVHFSAQRPRPTSLLIAPANDLYRLLFLVAGRRSPRTIPRRQRR